MINLLSPPSAFPGDADLREFNEFTALGGVSWYGLMNFEDSSLQNGSKIFFDRIVSRSTSREERQEALREVSPTTYLTEDSPPFLLAHGDSDVNVPADHAHYTFKKAGEVGVSNVELFIVKNAGHVWAQVGDEPITPGKEAIIKKTVDYFSSQLA